MRAAFLFLTIAPLIHAGWIRVTSPQFEILSDAGQRDTRLLAARLNQISNIFPASGPRTVRVFLFANEGELRAYHDTADGFFAPGVERD